MNGRTRSLARDLAEIEAALDAIEDGDLGPGPWRIEGPEVLAGFFHLPEGNRQAGTVRTDRDPRLFRCLPFSVVREED